MGAQYVPAVGFGLAIEKDRQRDGDTGPTKAVYTSGGEGSTSQGAFHEALNWAAREALPVLFHIQDNKYAISVPVEEQTAGGSIWHLLGGYAGLKRLRYDGTDYFQSVAAARAAMDHIRAGNGPVALHADLVRLFPHSSSDDHRKYRETASIEADAARDPLATLVRQLTEAGVVSEDEVEAMRAEVAAEIDRTAREVEAEPDPDPATATDHVYYEGDDERQYETDGPAGELVVMVDAINHALDEEMERSDRVLVYGEDVGGGKGGVFTATRGLTEKHGRDRCFNSPLAEHSVIGSAVGLAAAGYKPVVEIQFADYIWPGMQPLRNQVASMRYRSNGEWANPMVIRVPCGGYIHGGLCHSQNVEAMFGHFPGLQVVLPSNAADAKGLLKTAIRGEDPVIFLEHKALYRQGPARRPEPHADYLVPFGKAAIAREGNRPDHRDLGRHRLQSAQRRQGARARGRVGRGRRRPLDPAVRHRDGAGVGAQDGSGAGGLRGPRVHGLRRRGRLPDRRRRLRAPRRARQARGRRVLVHPLRRRARKGRAAPGRRRAGGGSGGAGVLTGRGGRCPRSPSRPGGDAPPGRLDNLTTPMRLALTGLGLVLLATAASAQGRLNFDGLDHDMGRLSEFELGRHTFSFTNTGDAPVELIEVESNCGCTVPEFTPGAVGPGGTGEIAVVYDTRGRPGPFERALRVTTDAGQAVTLRHLGRRPSRRWLQAAWPSAR